MKIRTLAVALVCLPTLLLAMPQPELRASDAATEARLALIDGDFAKAKEILEAAPEEVRKDAKLRRALGEQCMKWAKRRKDEAKRPGLLAAREHFEAAFAAKPNDVDSVVGALTACKELADLEVEAKRTDAALRHAAWAIDFGEKAVAAGTVNNDVKAEIARNYQMRARTASPGSELDQILGDYDRGAQLLVEAAEGHREERDMLIEAAELWMAMAQVVEDKLPEDDPRGKKALETAVEVVSTACEMKGAEQPEYAAHLKVLRHAKRLGLAPLPNPFMELVKPDPVEKLKLQLPRAGGWKVMKTADWDIWWDRHFEGEPSRNTIQIMVKAWEYKDSYQMVSWSDPEKLATRRYETKKREDFTEIVQDSGLVVLKGKGKKSPEIYHFQLGGKLKAGDRRQMVTEWIWTTSKKAKITYQIRMLDWGTPWATDDPDIAGFVASAIGPGLWPIGAEYQEEEDDKGKKKKKKKRKR